MLVSVRGCATHFARDKNVLLSLSHVNVLQRNKGTTYFLDCQASKGDIVVYVKYLTHLSVVVQNITLNVYLCEKPNCMNIILITAGLMLFSAFLYDFCSDYVCNECFKEMSKEEFVEMFGEDALSDDDDETIMVFDVEEASPYVFMMYITYYISWPVRKTIGLLK